MNRHRQLVCLVLTVGIATAQQTSAPTLTPQQQAARDAIAPVVKANTARIASGDTSLDAMKILQLQRDIESHTVAGDVEWVSNHLDKDFIMIHGDSWELNKSTGWAADSKDTYLQRVKYKMYLDREIVWSKVELHGDTAIVWGEYVAENAPGGTPRSWFNVWYERIFAKRNGEWYFLSHRTVNGPNFGADRASVLKIVHVIAPDAAQ